MAELAVAQSVLMLLVGEIDRASTAAVNGNFSRAFFRDSSGDDTCEKNCKNETHDNDDRFHSISPLGFLNLSKSCGVFVDG